MFFDTLVFDISPTLVTSTKVRVCLKDVQKHVPREYVYVYSRPEAVKFA